MTGGAAAHPGATERLHAYWVHGEGAAKIRWGEGGDFDRCVMHLGKFLTDPRGYCADAHHEALGIWPATHAAEIKKATGRSSVTVTERAAMPSASVNDLPDSDFAYVEPGGTKDSSGRTVPRSLRHFPVHDKAHVQNALSRAPQSPFGDKAMPKIKAAAKKFGVDVADDSKQPASRAEFMRLYALEDIHILRSADGGDGRTVEAYAAVFGEPAEIQDHEGHYIEEIDPGAFNRAIDHASRARGGFPGSVKVLWNHGRDLSGKASDRFSMPIGIPVDIRAEARGLLTRTRYSETPLADEVLENIRAGSITSQSFTGAIMRSSPQLRRGDKYRPRGGELTTVRRTELGLREYGPVLWPAYSGAEIVGVRMSTPGSWSPDPDETDEALPPDGEPATGDPLSRDDGDEHSARYHQHRLFVIRSREAREKAGLVWLPDRKERGMAALQELLDEQLRIRNELQRMEDSDETSEEADGDLRDTLLQRWEELDEKTKPLIERMEKIRSITRIASDEANLERPDGGGLVSGGGGRGPDLVTSRYRDPYEDLEAVRSHLVRTPELRGRALDAIEMEAKRASLVHDGAEAATQLIQRNTGREGRGIAEHILATGSEEYQEAFRSYLEAPQQNATRAALSLTQANGGYLLPFVLDPTIILTNASSANPWRRISRTVQTTSNTWNGVNSAGVNAAMLSEAAVVVDASPTVANIVITPQKATAWVYGSYEILEDTDFGQQLPALLADAKDRLEESQFATGTGTPPQTQGVVPAATTVVTTATTLVIALGDIYAVQAALPPRFRNAPGAAWVANVAIINKIRQLDTAGGSSFWTNLGKGQPETLLGAPIYESTTMTGSVATTSLEAIFGDFGQYIICDRVGVSMIYEPLVKSGGGILPTGQAGWFMFWRFGAQLSTVNAFRVMKGL